MRMLISKTRKTIQSKKGESLVESIVSLLILAIVLLTVTTMVRLALQITGKTLKEGTDVQETVINPAILSDYQGESDRIIFKRIEDEIPGSEIASHIVEVYENGGIVAIKPVGEIE